jgi:ankyrin repeat protein
MTGATPLLDSCCQSNGEVTRLLLAHEADVRAADNIRGLLPLHRACEGGYTEVARQLLVGGASVNEATPTGDLPLAVACSRRRQEVAQLLLDYASDNGEASTYC